MIATFLFNEGFRWSPETVGRMRFDELAKYLDLASDYFKQTRNGT